MLVDELLDLDELARCVDDGLVSVRPHDELPLAIHNYTARATYGGVWNPVTMACRGLVVDTTTSEVVARGFEKFFGLHELGDAGPGLSDEVEVFDKLDGSLGILITGYGDPFVATRGSFHSEQAVHATKVARRRFADFEPPDGVTALFEIIYPGNQIVVDYGDLDDLLLLGGVLPDGREVDVSDIEWPGLVANEFGRFANVEAVPPELMQRAGQEGLVLRFEREGRHIRAKLKQPDYVARHRAIFATSNRSLRLVYRDSAEEAVEFVAGLPEQIQPEFRSILERLEATAAATIDRARSRLNELDVRTRNDPRLLAEAVAGDELRPIIFRLARGQEVESIARKMAVDAEKARVLAAGESDE